MSELEVPNAHPSVPGARLEALLGRALGVDDGPLPPLEPVVDPSPPRSASRAQRRHHRPRRRIGAGRLAAGAVVVVLAAAWLLTANAGRSDPASPGARATEARGGEPVVADAEPLRAFVEDDADCVARPSAEPQLVCAFGAITVEYALPGTARVDQVYGAVVARVPLDPGAARSGPPACARGTADERAWSRPDAPAIAVGRYLCTQAGGRAALWWTVEAQGVIAHAVAPDADLGALFAWWQAHGEQAAH